MTTALAAKNFSKFQPLNHFSPQPREENKITFFWQFLGACLTFFFNFLPPAENK
jgi:hypothetical protein